MKNPGQLLEDSLLIIWNDQNSDERLKVMERIYSPDIHFYESDSGEPIIGFEKINNLITNLQSEWPPDFEFELSKPSQKNHNIQVASWILGIPNVNTVASGMDVAIIKDGKITSLHLYLD